MYTLDRIRAGQSTADILLNEFFGRLIASAFSAGIGTLIGIAISMQTILTRPFKETVDHRSDTNDTQTLAVILSTIIAVALNYRALIKPMLKMLLALQQHVLCN